MTIYSITIPAWAMATGIILLIALFLKLALKILLVIIIGSALLFVLYHAGFFTWMHNIVSGIM